MCIFQPGIPDGLCKNRQRKRISDLYSGSSFQSHVRNSKSAGIVLGSFVRNQPAGGGQVDTFHRERVVQFNVGRIVLVAFGILILSGEHRVPSQRNFSSGKV